MESNSNQSEFQDIKSTCTTEKPGNFYDAEYFAENNQIEGIEKLLSNKATDNNIDEGYNEEEGFFVQKKYSMESWYEFDNAIYSAAEDFYNCYGILPNMVVMNDFTYDQICWFCSISPKRAYISHDYNEEKIEISHFEFTDCALDVGTTPDTEDLKDMEFYIVYDDDDGDDGDIDDEPDIPVDGPGELLKIRETCERGYF